MKVFISGGTILPSINSPSKSHILAWRSSSSNCHCRIVPCARTFWFALKSVRLICRFHLSFLELLSLKSLCHCCHSLLHTSPDVVMCWWKLLDCFHASLKSIDLKKHRKNCKCCPGHSVTVSPLNFIIRLSQSVRNRRHWQLIEVNWGSFSVLV